MPRATPGAPMPNARCHQCQTTIVDYTPVAEAHGQIYCCPNCLRVSRADAAGSIPGCPTCEHCEADILDSSTLVERHGRYFCCYNCAVAVAEPLVAA